MDGARIVQHATKLNVGSVLPSVDLVGKLTPAIATLMDVKSSVFTPKGDVKPGFAEMQIRYEGGNCRLTMLPGKGQMQVKGLELGTDATRLHKVRIYTRQKKGKPPEAFVRFRLDLPNSADAAMNTYSFVLRAGGGNFDTTVSFEQVEQPTLFEPEKTEGKKKPGAKPGAKKNPKRPGPVRVQ